MRPLKSFRASLRYRISLVVAAMMAIAWTSAEAQRKSSPRLPFADTTGESDVYPIGDAVDVYRAVLDLFYIDGKEKAPVIVLVDTAQRAMGGPCTWRCTEKWRHKSRIDTATIIAYSRQSMKRPRIVGFRYPIRTVAVSVSEFERMTQEGFGLLSTRPADKVGPQEAFWAGFSKRFPGAWGYLMLGKVGFNPRHTEALIAAYQNCGPSCNSFETIFLKRLGHQWTVVERVPEWADSFQSGSNLRYRGPLAFTRGESQVLGGAVPGKPARSPSDDAGKVYAAVVEKLYNFYGQRPGRVVVTESRTYLATDRSAFHSRIDSSTFT
ncbi:MAG TPA: hypothetical protein VGO75_15740, partial [Gemmatimonadaceae bacterium]|nr:hypothetical protein [Gemmatimonadaceae bacterium]